MTEKFCGDCPVSSEQVTSVRSQSFEARDFYLACYLSCVGYELVELRREGRRRVFVFEARPSRGTDVMTYYQGRGTVSPLRFVSHSRDMKALLHNA